MVLFPLNASESLAEREIPHDIERIQVKPLSHIDRLALHLCELIDQLLAVPSNALLIPADQLVAKRMAPDTPSRMVRLGVAHQLQ
jgi:hypothetical protein